jgi:2-octaprenyl-6-methoxyphenol hydroxylase
MTPEAHVPVAIIGAGPVGATLAAALAARGVPCAVIDAQPLPPMELSGFDGRAYAIALTSRRLLEAAGVWDRLPATPCPIEGIKVADGRVDEAPSSLDLDFDSAEVGGEPFGWMVEARALRAALNARLPDLPGVQVFAPMTATVARDAEGATLTLADGRRLRARLVVGAEGANRRCAGGRHRHGAARLRPLGLVGRLSRTRSRTANRALGAVPPAGPFAPAALSDSPAAYGTSACRTPPPSSDRAAAVAERLLALDEAAFGRELRGASAIVSGGRADRPALALPLRRCTRCATTAPRLALVGRRGPPPDGMTPSPARG